ncbi:hypothetical protein GFL80_24270 [Rhizobium leguminosarum bv. viciae]|uniref:hypothetical protein n=1 Tax=Rhizobium leguminosarum TaxID=384 RepID=UPI001441F3AB|nr:hypothetical protein [Rhizobium leguminosarum]MDH6273633.1 hypothetical protein [Rhizobium leguminosarum]NKK01017.1 hypothetical protein [Rhizobium leguminosarum bv. viciae]NKK87292.1 hypothetical protein [Rhizobium leguminosarum bv. viciae]
MSKPPKTPAEWLTFLADLAEQHTLRTITTEGAFLQLSLIEFLRSAGSSGTSPLDLQSDLLTLLPRFCNALLQAEHAGAACRVCSTNLAHMLFSEITRDMNEISNRQETGGLH